eukprot:CAMPEP_0176216880 /NCGR_PEP_ID=MMETSP0121_2-20121125/17411_1 /TAXON_ID=160619 /ORGANISM="Kryptoperidinium foliaceum, Strain CCMP 1326" /LENGTH=319 /DNA_ID=CAMNT_0017556005 /DNA_START=20 /DNA_END=978 /DNA_ORIENTATION=-
MSYSTLDRFGGLSTHYAHARARDVPPTGTGLSTWWPDFGPGCGDFSQQRRSHPNEMIFEKVVEHKRWCAKTKPSPPAGDLVASQYRNPEPAKRATLHEAHPDAERRDTAHGFTERQASLRRLELRQRRVDAWAGEAPIRMGNALARAPGSQSSPDLACHSAEGASKVSRAVYEQHGFLIGKSQGSIADGRSGGGGAEAAQFAVHEVDADEQGVERLRQQRRGQRLGRPQEGQAIGAVEDAPREFRRLRPAHLPACAARWLVEPRALALRVARARAMLTALGRCDRAAAAIGAVEALLASMLIRSGGGSGTFGFKSAGLS